MRCRHCSEACLSMASCMPAGNSGLHASCMLALACTQACQHDQHSVTPSSRNLQACHHHWHHHCHYHLQLTPSTANIKRSFKHAIMISVHEACHHHCHRHHHHMMHQLTLGVANIKQAFKHAIIIMVRMPAKSQCGMLIESMLTLQERLLYLGQSTCPELCSWAASLDRGS